MGRHKPSESISSVAELIPDQNSSQSSKKRKLIIVSIISLFLLVSCAISAILLVHYRTNGSGPSESLVRAKPTQAISKTCSKTRYPELCVNSLLDFPGSLTADQRDLVHISVNMTLQRVGHALYGASEISNLEMDTRVRSAYEDCLELLEDSVDHLSSSLNSVGPDSKAGSTGDVLTWLSAALTNQDTCTEGFEDVNGVVKNQMVLHLRDLTELVSNCLAIYSASSDDEDFSGIPIQNRRKLLEYDPIPTYTTIPPFPPIFTNKPYVTPVFKPAAASGAGFIARDMTFENWAGPSKHQAVALRVGADHAVVYRCNVIGYQDTLYVHSQRQFYRECDIYGTVDFIFGNAAVVFQNCSIYARKPMAQQKNTITAQSRKDPNQNTGISIHNCRIVATSDLEASKNSFATYLGRPWKMYSRVVYMISYMGDHIQPQGWLEWNSTSALDKLYYGEYMNYGPGGAVGQRVKWPGYRVITSTVEASKFTVAQFIYGSSWLPSTGVAFVSGLSL
ncbi:hypothetical protein IFM89_015984 [Coptis chinensis]|uniref:Pectinesterase n=1 Tax=Coptis chinensis TaxID=261450 RepID=A0A835LMG6_9MAGN|nr:hypothetical protein IFM89_015984 [Coptis chinensis]